MFVSAFADRATLRRSRLAGDGRERPGHSRSIPGPAHRPDVRGGRLPGRGGTRRRDRDRRAGAGGRQPGHQHGRTASARVPCHGGGYQEGGRPLPRAWALGRSRPDWNRFRKLFRPERAARPRRHHSPLRQIAGRRLELGGLCRGGQGSCDGAGRPARQSQPRHHPGRRRNHAPGHLHPVPADCGAGAAAQHGDARHDTRHGGQGGHRKWGDGGDRTG